MMPRGPARNAATPHGLSLVEHDRPGVHVGVGVEIVGMRVVRIVLVEPPPVTETVEQVRGEQTEHPAGPLTTTDLTVGRVVTEEPDLRGDDSERRRKQQRPPGVVQRQHCGHCRRQCEQGDAERWSPPRRHVPLGPCIDQ
jgi:hypothetical protein